MEKQQTAVEWLYQHLFPKQLDGFSEEEWKKIDTSFEQAKQMEKEKMIDAIIFSEREHYIMGECWPTQTVTDKAERYYNETFKNK
jgi:hypothetical protein